MKQPQNDKLNIYANDKSLIFHMHNRTKNLNIMNVQTFKLSYFNEINMRLEHERFCERFNSHILMKYPLRYIIMNMCV